MGSDSIHVIDLPTSVYLKLWLLAAMGLVVPSAIAYVWPDLGWVGKAERAHALSLKEKEWKDPWLPIDQTKFSSGWIRCSSLEDAVKLDSKIDDGHLHTGNLVLSEGGLAWLER